jgi:carbamoyltransferase
VALNCVGNGRILREGPFENLWIQPAAGDAGGALGAALWYWFDQLGKPRRPQSGDSQHGSYLGPDYSCVEVRRELDTVGAVYEAFDNPEDLAAVVARALAEGEIVGHFSGRSEFGPRALGHRSLLGDPRNPDMQHRMNMAIKFRESFRPFAPSVIDGKQSEYFELDTESPYMLLTAPVRTDKRRKLSWEEESLSGVAKLKAVRSELPAVTHVDYSARIQTVSRERSPRFYAILAAFERLTGCPVLLNTSFNVRGEPIVNTPRDAYRCFMFTEMDVLVVENCLMRKGAQPAMARTAEYKKQFRAD